jgi:hypothetical protein
LLVTKTQFCLSASTKRKEHQQQAGGNSKVYSP